MSNHFNDDEITHLLSCEEARAKISIGRSKFRSLIQSGKLPVVWIGGCQRVRADDLARFIEELPDRDGKLRAAAHDQSDPQAMTERL